MSLLRQRTGVRVCTDLLSMQDSSHCHTDCLVMTLVAINQRAEMDVPNYVERARRSGGPAQGHRTVDVLVEKKL